MTSIPSFFFDPQGLQKAGTEYKSQYAKGDPFPHIVLDHFFPDWVLEEILKEFPTPEQIHWQTYQAPMENKKLASIDETQFGNFTRHFLSQLNSGVFLRFLEELTEIQNLIPDPYLLGGGLHQIKRGGFLKIHADFNRHSKLGLDRRLNLLIYLNKDWKEEYGGHFELWDEKMANCKKKLLPIFNRCVIFSTSRTSYHGHPEPLTCPEKQTRKSLALYYYSASRELQVTDGIHGTLFQQRPGEAGSKGLKIRNLLLDITPPFIANAVRSIRNKKRMDSE